MGFDPDQCTKDQLINNLQNPASVVLKLFQSDSVYY